MKAAGFRPTRQAINMGNPQSAAATILKFMEPDLIAALIVELEDGLNNEGA